MSWTSFLPIALRFLDFIINQSNLSDEAKKRFIALIDQAAAEGAISADLRNRFKEQQSES